MEEWLAEAGRAYSGATVVFDPFQAIGSMQRLSARGIPTVQFNFGASSVGRIAATLHRLLRDRLLALPHDAALLDDLANVRLRETTPGVVRLDHDPDRHDDRAVALALVATHLLESGLVAFDPRGATVGWLPAGATAAYTGWQPPGYDEPL